MEQIQQQRSAPFSRPAPALLPTKHGGAWQRWQGCSQSGLNSGHIHFGISHRHYAEKVGEALDNYLMPMFVLMSDPAAWQRRVGGGSYGWTAWKLKERQRGRGYGSIDGAVREQQWGLEYRAPPSWLVSQGIARAILCFSYVVVDAVIRDELPGFNCENTQAYDRGDKAFYRRQLGRIFYNLRQTPLYDEYKEEIEALRAFLKLGKDWGENQDALIRWGVRNGNTTMQTTGNLIPNGDDYVEELVRVANENDYYDGPHDILLYGISNERDDDVAIYGSERAARHLRQVAPSRNVTTNLWGCAQNHSAPIRIGLSRSIRADSSRARAYLQSILSNL
jgi:hypothetical protein